MKASTAALGLLLAGCGNRDQVSDALNGTASDPKLKPSPAPAPVLLRGAVAGAFQLTVDGVAYRDSEDFYTSELARLPERVREAGHDLDGLVVRFSARVGLGDLWAGMLVFVAPASGQGAAGSVPVRPDGTFAFSLPAGTDAAAAFQLRAVKRISVELVRAGTVEERWCYLLSAREAAAVPGQFALLQAFDTQLTAYECEKATGGLSIPASE